MSNKRKINEFVEAITLPIVEKHGFELVDVEFIKEGTNWYLRVYIDKPEGIDLDDCQTISHEISKQLDEQDPIEQAYFLEVCSPGLDRALKKDKEFVKYAGEEVEVKLFSPIDGQKAFEGELVGLENDKIVIIIKKEKLSFDRDKVASVKRVVKF